MRLHDILRSLLYNLQSRVLILTLVKLFFLLFFFRSVYILRIDIVLACCLHRQHKHACLGFFLFLIFFLSRIFFLVLFYTYTLIYFAHRKKTLNDIRVCLSLFLIVSKYSDNYQIHTEENLNKATYSINELLKFILKNFHFFYVIYGKKFNKTTTKMYAEFALFLCFCIEYVLTSI